MASARVLVALTIVLCTAATAQPPSRHTSEPSWKAEVDHELDTLSGALDAEAARFSAPALPADRAWVAKKLRYMVNIDQTVRNAFTAPKIASWPQAARDYFYRELIARMSEIDRANTAELKNLIKIHGWFTISKFGKDTEGDAWLLVQHADHDTAFQQEVLGILTELFPKAETNPGSYAYLWDRVAGHTGKKQRYGTQGRCVGPGTWEPFEMEDPANVDARRASVGLPPMAEYKQGFKDRGLCP